MKEQTEQPWQVIVLARAKKRLQKMPQQERERFVMAFRQLQADPFLQDIRQLKGRPEYRLRIGSWRALVRIDQESKTVYITELGPRGDVYK